MNYFKEIYFKGNFRSYQSRVLGNVNKYLADGKINISNYIPDGSQSPVSVEVIVQKYNIVKTVM